MGRSKLTPEIQSSIVDSILGGNYAKVSAEASGISETTFYRWMSEGERAKSGKMREFWESVTRAQGESETVLLSRVNTATQTDWRAATWLLERRFSKRWANTQRLEVQVEKEFDAMLGTLEEQLDPHEFRKVAGILAGVGESGAEKDTGFTD